MHNKQQITGWLFLLLLCVAGCGQPVSKKQNTMINWKKLPDLPGAADTASLGVSAPFAGIHNGVLIVAGGCNFPDKPVTEGGAKRYYSEIFVLLPEGWKEIDRLPRPVAYGATVSTPEGIVCIGGNNSDSSLVEVSRISYNPTKGEVAALPYLLTPQPREYRKGMGTTTGLPGSSPCTTGISGRRKSQRHTYLSSRRLPAHPKRRGTDRPDGCIGIRPGNFYLATRDRSSPV